MYEGKIHLGDHACMSLLILANFHWARLKLAIYTYNIIQQNSSELYSLPDSSQNVLKKHQKTSIIIATICMSWLNLLSALQYIANSFNNF